MEWQQNTTFQNLWYKAKLMIMGKFIVSNTYLEKKKDWTLEIRKSNNKLRKKGKILKSIN